MYTGKMDTKQFLFPFIFALTFIKSSQSLNSTDCGVGYRRPAYNDITVECGTSSIGLAILVCPVMYTGYNETHLVMNNENDENCKGTLDASADPPVVRFTFPLNQTNACGSIFTTTSAPGTGIFSDFSNIQTVNVSGLIQSSDPTTGTITYNEELKYFYSCAYPLEYLVNNTQIDVSGSSIAVRDDNGTFISTLSLELYSDANYTNPMNIPALGLELRTVIYVQVKATNLTSQYFVLLDRCYASISPYPTASSFFNLFVSCSKDDRTIMLENGESHNARFSFPAFRFTEQQNETVSTYYLHCITRLCERSTCPSFKKCDARRRRNVEPAPIIDGASNSTTITSRPIVTKAESIQSSKEEAPSGSHNAQDSSVGLAVAVGILAVVLVGMLGVVFVLYKRQRPGTKIFPS